MKSSPAEGVFETVLFCTDFSMNADLLVIGRQGRSSLGRVLFGNVTEKVVRKARCAVLVIPLSLNLISGRAPLAAQAD
ncbi:MAG: universal stress protein [Lentisphaerae bacterium]|nr:universal stress protein [Lentisphaerota bacterium]